MSASFDVNWMTSSLIIYIEKLSGRFLEDMVFLGGGGFLEDMVFLGGGG